MSFQQKMRGKEASVALRKCQAMQRRADATVSLSDGRRVVNFSDNDFLGLSWNVEVQEAARKAVRDYGSGAGASRLVSGNSPLYDALEQALAEFKGEEASLIFGSGYLANIGVIPALAEAGDLILADKLIHASLVDAIRLSGSDFQRFPHNDTAHLARLLERKRAQYRHCIIVTEGVFSMDGDQAPLQEISHLAEKYDGVLVVDDAHGFGVLGQGKGTLTAQGVSPKAHILQIGTFSKALGSYGGYVCGAAAWCEYLLNFSRSVTYTTALPPATLAAALAGLKVIESHPQDCVQPLNNAAYFCEKMALPAPESPIVPMVIGENEKTLKIAEILQRQGYLVGAIRPPTVPKNTARLRITFSASHSKAQIDGLVAALQAVA